MAFERITMWVRDRMTKDPHITETPVKALNRLEKALVSMEPAQRLEAAKGIKHYANYYYVGRHQMDHIPADLKQRVSSFEARIGRLNAVDEARAYLEKHGAPKQALKAFTMQANRSAFQVSQPASNTNSAKKSQGLTEAQGFTAGMSI